MNILLFCSVMFPGFYGDTVRVLSLTSELVRRGHDVNVFTFRRENEFTYGSLNINGVRIHQFGVPAVLRKLRWRRQTAYFLSLYSLPSFLNRAVSMASVQKPDVLQAYMPGLFSSLPAVLCKRLTGIPVLVDFPDLDDWVRPRILRAWSFRESDAVTITAEVLRQRLREYKVPDGKIFFLPNGVDINLFSPRVNGSDARSRFGEKDIVLFVGALQDLTVLINAAKHVLKQHPNTLFLIVGDHTLPGLRREDWEEKVRQRGLSDNFIFVGRVPHDHIPSFIAASDVCVDTFSNRPYFAAAHPVKVLEYMSCGKPVVATELPGTMQTVKHGVHGYLAEPGDPQEFAKYVNALLDDGNLRIKLGRNGRKLVESEYAWESLTKKLEHVYRILCDRKC